MFNVRDHEHCAKTPFLGIQELKYVLDSQRMGTWADVYTGVISEPTTERAGRRILAHDARRALRILLICLGI